MEQRQSSRKLTKTRVAQLLAGCIIPTRGSNKLPIVGRGNPFTREDGTQVRIFNVQAFGSQADADEAAKHFKAGVALENSGDIDAAQEPYKAAMNKMMSFSVLEQNAPAFASAYQIIGLVEDVETRDGGKKLGINNPRPVAVETSGTNTAHLFELPKDVIDEGNDVNKIPSATTQAGGEGKKPSLSTLQGRTQTGGDADKA
jgi:hypothetical protein